MRSVRKCCRAVGEKTAGFGAKVGKIHRVKAPRYAGLADLRRAIAQCEVIEFTHHGVSIEAEPMAIGSPREGAALVLSCWILKASDGREPGMVRFQYSHMREMYPTGVTFTRRRFYEREPEVTVLRRGASEL